MREKEPRIREATPYDVPGLSLLMGELGYPTSEEEMERRFAAIEADGYYGTLVAELEGEVVGMGGVMLGRAFEFDGVYARLVALVVASRYRGNGVGRALLAACEEWAQGRSAQKILLNSGKTRAGAHELYRSAGYAETGLRFVKPLARET